MSEKIDFKKTLREFYLPSAGKVVIVEVPEMKFLQIEGKGSPGDSQEYQDALGSLYPVAFKTKFISKQHLGKDYVVPPLEGLWWAENMDDFRSGNRDKWKWTMMIMQPDWITEKIILEAKKISIENKPELSKGISSLRLERYNEGLSAQTMHLGPFSTEEVTIDKVHEFIKENGGIFHGHKQFHHEIYLSDPRKAKPEKLKTVIRQPFVVK